jgi:fucose permease
MSELAYLLSVLLSLAAYAVAGAALWAAVEGSYYLFCKITGREY